MSPPSSILEAYGIPEHLAMRVISYSLLLGADYNVTGARQYGENEIIIFFEKDGKRDWCIRPLNPKKFDDKKNSLGKTQKIPTISSVEISDKPPEANTYLSSQITKANVLTRSTRIYGVKMPKCLPEVIDVKEVKEIKSNFTKMDYSKPYGLQESPDKVSTVRFHSFNQSYEKHIIEI